MARKFEILKEGNSTIVKEKAGGTIVTKTIVYNKQTDLSITNNLLKIGETTNQNAVFIMFEELEDDLGTDNLEEWVDAAAAQFFFSIETNSADGTIVVDTIPINGSPNAVSSNGVFDALSDTLDNANAYSDAAVVQLIGGAPSDSNTLKELNDKIIAINAIIGGSVADGDTLVNTVAELLAVFSSYPEGTDIITLLADKINSTDIINNLTQVVTGKVLDATQGKALKDLIDDLTNTVNDVISNSVLSIGGLLPDGDGDLPLDTTPTASSPNPVQSGGVKTYVDLQVSQLINGAPSDGNTLKELNDKIVAINAIIGSASPDGDSLVNTVTELLAVFSTYAEGVDIATTLAGKINTADIINNLTQVVTGKVLDATQGKALKDLIDTLTTTVSGKEATTNKDATGGYVGLTLFKINFKNALNTFTSFLTNANTAARTYIFPDRDGTIADDTDLATKVNKTAATSGSVISFATPQVYNTNSAPSSSNITDSMTSAAIGNVQKIYSNKSVEPTYPAGWVKVGPGAYTVSALNIIYAEWTGSTRVEYWIVQPAS